MDTIRNIIPRKTDTLLEIIKVEGILGVIKLLPSKRVKRCILSIQNIIERETTLGLDNINASFALAPKYGGEKIRWMFSREKKCIKDVISEVEEGDVFWDIGANIGIYTCFLSAMRKKVKIYSFEPHPENYKSLKNNIKKNNGTVYTKMVAIGSEEAEGYLTGGRIDNAGSQSMFVSEKKSINEKACKVRSGDHMVKEGLVDIPNIIKIDVEGAEMSVLKGMKTILINSDCRIIYCEIHKEKVNRPRKNMDHKSYKEVEKFIESMGFSVHIMEDTGTEVVVKAIDK